MSTGLNDVFCYFFKHKVHTLSALLSNNKHQAHTK